MTSDDPIGSKGSRETTNQVYLTTTSLEVTDEVKNNNKVREDHTCRLSDHTVLTRSDLFEAPDRVRGRSEAVSPNIPNKIRTKRKSRPSNMVVDV